MKSAYGILGYIQTQGYEAQVFGQLAKLKRSNSDNRLHGASLSEVVQLKRVVCCQAKYNKKANADKTTKKIIRQKDGKRTEGSDKDKIVKTCHILQSYKKSGWERFVELAVRIILSVFGLISNNASIKFATDLAKIIFEYLTE